MVIIGIDPGTIRMGYAIIKSNLSNKTKVEVLKLGIIDLKNIQEHAEKLKVIYEEVQDLLEKFSPDSMAIESPFHGKNVQSMLKLGRSQGIAMAVAYAHNMTVSEYFPKQIKLSITGNGNASKEQVLRMLQQLYDFDYDSKYLDASDALAVAVCHHFYISNSAIASLSKKKMTKSNNSKKSNWKSFIEKNPHRKI
ncbi:MAG: crossover junction endodeoxyribonuclease RuvC [Bacteroidia bacterium]|nr:MAG: crossover junction endodeoxyribonuclease RuvC [Bacteroidia bacterium]